MIKSAGSLDDIQDALEALDRTGAIYLLLIARPGEQVTRVWSVNRGNVDDQTKNHLREVLSSHIDHYWARPDGT